MNSKCPCSSGKFYNECCGKFHKGALPENALVLMRSRYTAYAMGLINYIIATTHPTSASFQWDLAKWTEQLNHFCSSTTFQKLEIIEFIDGEEIAWVTFKAHLNRDNKDASFTERSRFLKVDQRWLYA